MPRRKEESLWDDVATWLTGAAGTAIREAEDLTRRGRLKMEILRLSQQTEKLLARLGGRVYRLYGTSPASVADDPEVNRLITELKQLDAELTQRRSDYEAEKKRKG